MQHFWKDLAYGARQLRRNPGFTAVAVVSLVLGIAANTAIFTLLDSLLLRPLPGRNPSELVTVYTSDYSGPLHSASSYPDFRDFQERNQVLSGLAAYSMQPLLLTPPGGTESTRVLAQLVSGNYFDVLGVAPANGRTFLPEEDDAPNAHPVLVLAYLTWQRQFGGDPNILGRTVRLNGRDFTVVGVAPEGFQGVMRGLHVDLWAPIAMMPALSSDTEALSVRGNRDLQLVGRLMPDVGLEQAQSNFSSIAMQLRETYPGNWTNLRGQPRVVTLLGEEDSRVMPQAAASVKLFLWLLLVVVGLVLLIACVNVANLMLARGAARRKEIAIRLAQGASRSRLVFQLMTESVLLAGLAGTAGLLLAWWATRLLAAYHPPLPLSLSLDLSMDRRVLAFALLMTAGASILFGLLPALRASRIDLVQTLNDGGSGSGRSDRRPLLRQGLVSGQVAISLLLLIGTGLLLRSMGNIHAIDPGFKPDNVLLLSMDLKTQGYSDRRGMLFYRELQERVEQIPGVEAVSISDRLPLGLDWQR